MDEAILQDAVRAALDAMLRDAPEPLVFMERAKEELLEMLSKADAPLDETQRQAVLKIVHEVVSDAAANLRRFPPAKCT